VHTTACPRNCYSTCGMRVLVEDGAIRRIEPHPGNRATPEGVCLKGLSYIERVRSPDRILTPLRRTAAGDFEPVGWDSALDEITERLIALRDETGPQGLLYYAASGTKGILNGVGLDFWRLYGGCTTTYGDLCWPAGLEATRLTLGDNRHSVPWDIARARLILMWGKNAAETNIHQMPFIQEAREAGGRLVVIDPRRTESTESADMWIRPRPGTDGALALALAGEIIRSGTVDHDFIRESVAGFPEFSALASECSPEWASDITDVAADEIRRLATWIGASRPMTITAGYGMQRYTNAGQTMRAIVALLAITGNFGRPGAGWVYANHLRRGEGSPRLLPARAPRRRRACLDLDGPARPGHAGPDRPTAPHGLDRAREPGHAEPGDQRRARVPAGARVPGGRGPVPHGHGQGS